MFDLAGEMSRLPEPVTDKGPPHWEYWRNQLWWLAQEKPAWSFLGWPCIYHTMCQLHWPGLVERERNQMLQVAGKLPDYRAVSSVSGDASQQENNIRQAHHLWKWQQVTGKKIADLESIVEVGGGYGAACLMARRMGFTGKYTIYDLPEFSLLQRYYLEEAGVTGVEFVTEPPDFAHHTHPDLMVGIYSLSEMPESLRWSVLEGWTPEACCFLYSGQWETYDNVSWFQEAMPRILRGKQWHHEEAAHHNDRNNWYSIGWTG